MIDVLTERVSAVEEALMLFMALLTGQPEDATDEEKLAAQIRLAALMEGIRERHK